MLGGSGGHVHKEMSLRPGGDQEFPDTNPQTGLEKENLKWWPETGTENRDRGNHHHPSIGTTVDP